MEKHQKSRNKRNIYFGFLIVAVILMAAFFLYFMKAGFGPESSNMKAGDTTAELGTETVDADTSLTKNVIDEKTGMIEGTGMMVVVSNCTPCHSAKLVTQNRMTREGWLATIRWMQETQNLWDLGKNEPIILDYLAKYYAPKYQGRRAPLSHVQWYKLQQ